MLGAGFFYPDLAAYQARSRISAQLQEESFVEAAESLRQLSQWRRNDPEVAYLYAVLARRNGQVDAFRSWMDVARQLGKSEKLLEIQNRLLSAQLGNLDATKELELSETAANSGSDDIAVQTYDAIAAGYLRTYRLKEAWQCISYWLEWRPNTASARLMLADIYERTGVPQMAVEEYRKILEFAPEHRLAKQKLASSLLTLNEVDEAAELLRGLRDQNPSIVQVLLLLAEAERRLGNLDESQAAVDAVFQLGLDDVTRGQCNTIAGQLSLANQKPQEAVDFLLVAVDLAPQDAVSQLALGRALTLTGRKEIASVHLELAAKIRDNYEKVQTLTKSVVEDPNNPALRTDIGQALIAQGLVAEGRQWIETALVCDPNYEPAKQLLQQSTSAPSHATP